MHVAAQAGTKMKGYIVNMCLEQILPGWRGSARQACSPTCDGTSMHSSALTPCLGAGSCCCSIGAGLASSAPCCSCRRPAC